MKLKVKVCGMRDAANIVKVAETKPDFMGFIFYNQSPRYVGEAFEIPLIPSAIDKVGVFVNHSFDFIILQSKRHSLGYAQLHGTESVELCTQLKSSGLKVIKVFNVDSEFDFGSTDQYQSSVDYFLFDTRSSKLGGSGKSFDWSILSNYRFDIPFFLSGGINQENVNRIVEINHPNLFAVDLNSGVEESPGFKDINKLKSIISVLNKVKL